MKTIKLPYKTTEDLTSILKQYSNVVRYSYNRFIENKSEKDIRELSKSMNSVDLLNSWLIQCGIKDGKAIQIRFKNEKVILFGGKYNLINRLKNKISNRKNKNLWKRELFINNLTKRLNILGIKLYSVNPAYSSFIGNLMYDYTDAVNASIEIGRRGFEYRIKKNKKEFYPKVLVKHQWKEMATKYTDWKKFFIEVKNLKLKYRVSLDELKYKFNVFQQNSTSKSMVLNYVFYC